MIIFNGTEYYSVNYYGADLRIESPHNIIDYTQMLLNGEYPDGKIFKIKSNDLVEISRENLLRKMCKCIDINLYLLNIDECKNMDVITLQNLSEDLPLGLSEEEVRKFVMLNKYERNMIINSGFNAYELTECYKALLKCKETFGEHIEYTAELNDFLHQHYTIDSTSNGVPILDELIAIYYQYPHIADLLSHGNRRGASFIYSMLHETLDLNKESYDVFNKKHIMKLNQIEELVSYYYGHHFGKDERMANMVERNLSSLINSEIIPKISPYINILVDRPTPEGIIVQPGLGDENKPNTELEQKFKNDFRGDTIKVDNTKYILSNINESTKRMGLDSFETLQIKELNLRINCKKDSNPNYDRGYHIVFQVLQRINDMNLVSNPLSPDDICDELRKMNIDTRTEIAPTILEKTLQILNDKINFKNIPELNDIHISHIYGAKYTLPSRQQYFIHCIHASDMRLLTSSKSDKLDVIIDRQYHRDHHSKKALFIMPNEMIQELKLPSLDSIRESIIRDSKIIDAAKDAQYRDIAKDVYNKALGLIPIVDAKPPYKDLANRFQRKFGHIPRILPQISVAINNYFNGSTYKAVETFNYKRISKIQGAKTPIMIKLSSTFDWNRVPIELQQLLKYNVTSTNINSVCKCSDIIIEFYYNAKNKDLLDFINVIDKIPNESISNLRKKINLLNSETNINKKNEIKIDIQSDIKTLVSFTKQQRGLTDARKAEKKYDYFLINNSSDIMGDNVCIMSGAYKAYFLNSLDSRHFSVGYDTACCQHIEGAGQECVIAATSSPHCGTFVIESDGVIKAQAFVWEALNRDGNKVLVLDNIEFANDRDARDYMEILYGFCKESPYETIHMGLSYNAVSHIGRTIDDVEYVEQPVTTYLNGEFYSDYDGVVALKTNGKMEFDVADCKYYIHNFETPTILESSTHCINKTKDSLVAQHYDEVYDIASKTTMVFASDGTKKEPDIIRPTYSFDSTMPLKHNCMMKWNEIQPNDIAVTVTHIQAPELSKGQYIIKPISFDGKEIVMPNTQQKDGLFKEVEKLMQENPEDIIFLNTYLGNIPIQCPNDLLHMNTENYLSAQTNDLFYDELTKLKEPSGDAPSFDDGPGFGGELEMDGYEEADYDGMDSEYIDGYIDEDFPER